MNTLSLVASLPFGLEVSGQFTAGVSGPVLRLSPGLIARPGFLIEGVELQPPYTRVEVAIDGDTNVDEETAARQKNAEAARLLMSVNRFLRWYRSIWTDARAYEVTRAQMSPFTFFSGPKQVWGDALVFEPTAFPPAAADTLSERRVRLIGGFGSGSEPDVADLALADAAGALNSGRFREAVLLCWSAIDATFTRRFEQLVDERLGNDWGEARKFLKGLDFGLRHKMTTGLRLLTGRSFFDLPGNFWDRLSESYRARNRIIHEGAAATEDEARRSIQVAHELVQAVRAI